MLGQYSIFEEYHSIVTGEQYAQLATERSELPAREFFNYLHQQLNLEFERTKAVLQVSSWSVVRKAAEQAYLRGQMDRVAAGSKSRFVTVLLQLLIPSLTAIGDFMETKDWDMTTALYNMFLRAGASEVLRAVLRDFVFKSVSTIVLDTDKARQEEMVPRLLEFNALCETASAEAFVDADPFSTACTPNAKYKQAIHEGFRTGFQKRRNKPAEMIARYLDRVMRKGQQGTTDQAFHKLLDEALALYRYTDDKDVFRTFYNRHLAKRLLTGRMASSDIERTMLKKLTTNYDASFDVGETMFNDLQLSRDMIDEWHSRLHEDDANRKLNVYVLTHSVWPFSTEISTLLLPTKVRCTPQVNGRSY